MVGISTDETKELPMRRDLLALMIATATFAAATLPAAAECGAYKPVTASSEQQQAPQQQAQAQTQSETATQ
jgi:hypothetical protein